MKIAVVGLGSMGKRRIRLIREMYPEYNIIGIDEREDRRTEVAEKFEISCTSGLDKVSEHIDCVFVCTSPLSHNAIIYDALIRGYHVFTEMNLVSEGYGNNLKIAEERDLKLFLSSTFLYREEIKCIKDKVSKNKKWNYIYHVGQYLPDWHPWESYNDFFLGDKRTNGCRELLAIELPWLVATFGKVGKICCNHDKLTGLNIDYEDNFMIQLCHKNGNKGSLIVDVVSPVAVRKLEVYSENSYIFWDGTPESLREYNIESKQLEHVNMSEKTEHVDGYREFVVENAYKNEIRGFFEYVQNDKIPVYGFEEDKEILGLIDEIGA